MSTPLSPVAPGEAAILARGISKRYEIRRHPIDALSGVDLAIPKGKIYGLIGRNGAGKTTFVRIAATQLMPTSGSDDASSGATSSDRRRDDSAVDRGRAAGVPAPLLPATSTS